MIEIRSFGQVLKVQRKREGGVAAAVVILLVLALQCSGLRAELFFRGVEQVDGQQRWLPVRSYSNPSDTVAYTRVSASGAAMPAEEVYVFVTGQITFEDVDSAELMESLLKTGKQTIVDNTVWFAGLGGDLDAAMELGRRLRRLGLYTRVGEGNQCLSACVFAFMGGERRIVAGRLGIHRPFFVSTQAVPDRKMQFRNMQKSLRNYFEELDFPTSLYEAVMLVPPETMHMLKPADLKRFYLEGISPSSEDVADAALARRLGISMYEYLERKAKAPGAGSGHSPR